jgi:hypothetical protein
MHRDGVGVGVGVGFECVGLGVDELDRGVDDGLECGGVLVALGCGVGCAAEAGVGVDVGDFGGRAELDPRRDGLDASATAAPLCTDERTDVVLVDVLEWPEGSSRPPLPPKFGSMTRYTAPAMTTTEIATASTASTAARRRVPVAAAPHRLHGGGPGAGSHIIVVRLVPNV